MRLLPLLPASLPPMVLLLGLGLAALCGSHGVGEVRAEGPDRVAATVTPIGFKNLWWGAPAASVLALRGGLEEQADLDPDVVHYIEDLGEGGGPVRARYTFWRDQLMAVGLWYPAHFAGQLPRDVIRQFVMRWGSVHEEVFGEGMHRNTPVAWVWRSPVSELTVQWDPGTQEFRQIRRSVLVTQQMDEARERRQVEARSEVLRGLVGDD